MNKNGVYRGGRSEKIKSIESLAYFSVPNNLNVVYLSSNIICCPDVAAWFKFFYANDWLRS